MIQCGDGKRIWNVDEAVLTETIEKVNATVRGETEDEFEENASSRNLKLRITL